MHHNQTAKNSQSNEQAMNMSKTIEQQLADANAEIEDLKMQIAWLDRSYE